MNDDRIDTLARGAAADLHRQVDEIDTEAALTAFHRTAGGGRHRARRLVTGRRSLTLVAAAVLVVGVLALAAGAFRGGDRSQRVGTVPAEPVDPQSYGPLLGTLHGLDAPALTARVYGPAALEDRSEVAVAITGGLPGQDYLVTQCAVGDPDYTPVVNCGPGQHLILDHDGTGVGVVEAWTVFDGQGAPYRNDCRAVACELQISALIGPGQPDEGRPGTKFAEQPEISEALSRSPWIPIHFADDAGAPPLPAITATFLERTGEGTRVRIEGTELKPGRASIVVDGFFEQPTGFRRHLSGVGPTEIARADVADDGALSMEVTLPDAITETGEHVVNGVVQDPEVLACGVGTSYCTVQVLPLERGPDPASGSARLPLVAQPVRYPEGP
ncbi:hypothetical protein [Aquihabitans sp. McL0605]|uniref:hypothetical protein n=1 Tax=Aquihabitans sp. McL0605 TaxID=3415671 RepID=UPI003CF6555D